MREVILFTPQQIYPSHRWHFDSPNTGSIPFRCAGSCVGSPAQLNGTEPSLMVLVTFVLFLLWQFKMSAVKTSFSVHSAHSGDSLHSLLLWGLNKNDLRFNEMKNKQGCTFHLILGKTHSWAHTLGWQITLTCCCQSGSTMQCWGFMLLLILRRTSYPFKMSKINK